MLDIRSYRRVFDLERRIYRIDRLRLNPGGIPVRGACYFLAILASGLVSANLPILADLAQAVPWYVRDLALPSICAAVLTMIQIEGRPFHLAAGAMVRYAIGPHRLAGGRPCRRGHPSTPGERWYPGEIVLLPDGSDCRMRRLRYAGPGAVLVAVAHERGERGRWSRRKISHGSALTLRELPEGHMPDCDQVIALAHGGRMVVEGSTTL